MAEESSVGVDHGVGADLQPQAEPGASTSHPEPTLDAATLRWAEDVILSGVRLWKDRRNKMARGTDRSSVDALCEVLNGMASVIGGKAELTEEQATGDKAPASDARGQRIGEEVV